MAKKRIAKAGSLSCGQRSAPSAAVQNTSTYLEQEHVVYAGAKAALDPDPAFTVSWDNEANSQNENAMTRTLQAVYEHGAFHPLEPVSCSEHERVIITIENAAAAEDNLLDHEFLAYCETQADDSVSLETVRQALAKIPGSLSDDIRAERDER